MRRLVRVVGSLPVVVAALAAGGAAETASAAAIADAPSVGVSFVDDRALDSAARARFGLGWADATAASTTTAFTCEVMGMTADDALPIQPEDED